MTNIKLASEEPKKAPYNFTRQQTNESVTSISISVMTPSEASEQPEEPSDADIEDPERHVSFGRQSEEEELTFSIHLKPSNAASSYLLCPTASFNPDWMRNQDSKLFRCSCNNCNELDYTRKPQHHFSYLNCPGLYLTLSSGACKHLCPHHN